MIINVFSVHPRKEKNGRGNPQCPAPLSDQILPLYKRRGDSGRENHLFSRHTATFENVGGGNWGDTPSAFVVRPGGERAGVRGRTRASVEPGVGVCCTQTHSVCCAGEGVAWVWQAHGACRVPQRGGVLREKGGRGGGGLFWGGSPRLGDGLEGQGGIQEGGCQ